MKLQAIEGNTQRLDGGALFGNAPKALWSKWTDVDEHNRIPTACRALHVETDDGRNFLFDVGVGAFFEPKLKDRYGVSEEEHVLLNNLEKKGLLEEDIDGIVLSHLHFDHCGGLLSHFNDGPPRLLFPNATYYVPHEHWERAQNPHHRERASFLPHLHRLLEDSGRMILVEGPYNPDLDFGVTFRFVHGHTVGLMLTQLDLDSGPLIFVADLVPGLNWVHLPLTMGYDRFPELVVEEKKALYEEMIEKEGKFFFTHDPNIPCAALKMNEKGRYLGEAVSLSSLT